MDRSLLWHTALSTAAVACALVAWKADFSSSDKGENLYSNSPRALESIHWTDSSIDVHLAREEGRGIRVKYKKVSDADLASKNYPASERAARLFESYALFPVARKLGKSSSDELVAFGLDEASRAEQATLKLSFKQGERTLQFGKLTFAKSNRYAMAEDGEALLIRAKAVSLFSGNGLQLLDKRLMGIAAEDIRKIILTTSGRERHLVQRYGEDKKRAFIADPAVPDERLDASGRWVEQVLRTRIDGPSEEKPQGTPVLKVEFYGSKDSLGALSVWKLQGDYALATSTLFDTSLKLSASAYSSLLGSATEVLDEGR